MEEKFLENMLVCICLCTRRRPNMLRACVESLAQLSFGSNKIIIIIVDNEDEQSTAEAVTDGIVSPWQIINVVEENIGIPIARNRAVKLALDLGADWLAFIDDDEIADPEWINQLSIAAKKYNADVVQGPVLSIYEAELPPWFANKKKKPRATGTILGSASTNNTLVSRNIFTEDGFNLSFDLYFRFTGGSDTALFTKAKKNGAKIVWCSSAIVKETVPASRLTLKWQLRRAFRVAENETAIILKIDCTPRSIVAKLIKAISRIMGGLVICTFAIPEFVFKWNRTKRLAQGCLLIASGLGNLASFLGIKMKPYKSIEGN